MCKYIYAVCLYQIVCTCLAPLVDRVIITAMKPESNDSFCEYWQLVQTSQWGEEGHRQHGDHIIIVLSYLGKNKL